MKLLPVYIGIAAIFSVGLTAVPPNHGQAQPVAPNKAILPPAPAPIPADSLEKVYYMKSQRNNRQYAGFMDDITTVQRQQESIKRKQNELLRRAKAFQKRTARGMIANLELVSACDSLRQGNCQDVVGDSCECYTETPRNAAAEKKLTLWGKFKKLFHHKN